MLLPTTTQEDTMHRKHLIAGAATLVALAGGTAGAVAATTDQKAAEQTVLADAAKRLGVGADELRDALANAEDAQLDAEVKAGRLTQEQADAIKQRREADGTVLDLGHGGPGHGHGGPGGHFLLADAADAIGISEDALMSRLRDGRSLAAIAKARGTTLAEVKAAVKQAATRRLDADLKAGRTTQAEHDEAVDHLDEEIGRLGERPDRRFDGPRSRDDEMR
jgi:hypothetical protein